MLLSFLFFCVYNLCQCENQLSYGKETDSLKYYSNLVNFPDSDSSLTRAYNYFNKKRLESIYQNDTKTQIVYLKEIAILQFELGDYYGSEVTVVEVLKLLDKSNQTSEGEIGLLNLLGRIYTELLDYDAAIKYFDEALEITESKNYRNIIQNNKALVYIQQQNYELAEKEFLEVFKNSASLEDKEQLARAQSNLGHVQSKLNKSEALDNLIDALRIRMSIQDNAGIYSSYSYLSEHYKDRNDDRMANDYANKGYQIAKLINSPSFIKDALSNLMDLGNYVDASEYIRISDSLQNVKQIQENKYAKIKYDYTEKEKLAKDNELEKEKQRRLKLLYLSIAGFVTLLAVFVIILLKAKYKRDKMRQVYITETRISKRVHDEVANDVYQVMTKLQGSEGDKEVLLDDLEDIYNRTRDISRDNSTLEVKEHFDTLLNDLLLKYKSGQVNIVTRNLSKIDWDSIESIKKITIYRVIQELMVNMKKHSQASLVVLNFNQSNNKIILSYNDNGVGCNIKSDSGGLKNAENRIKSINGTIIFESETHKGFKAKITV